jgi:MFS family permease
MGISTQTFFLYFIHDELAQTATTLNPEGTVALLAMLGQAAGAITCYPIGIISDQYFNSRRKPFVYAACICLGLGNLALVLCTNLEQMMMVVTLLGAANGMYLTMDTSLAVDTLEIDSNGQANSDDMHEVVGAAQLLGVWGVFGFIGSAMGPLIGGIVLTFIGRQDTNFGQFYSLQAYQFLFSLTAVYFLCSAVSLAFVKKKGV